MQRDLTHLLQCFNGTPGEKEIERFKQWACEAEFIHRQNEPFYDIAMLLSPYPARSLLMRKSVAQSNLLTGISVVNKHLNAPKTCQVVKKGVIISKAFPVNSASEYQQRLTDAVHAFMLLQTVLERDGILIFGCHPTFIDITLVLF